MGISQTDETSGIISYSPKGYSVFVHAFQLGGIWNVFNGDKKKPHLFTQQVRLHNRQ